MLFLTSYLTSSEIYSHFLIMFCYSLSKANVTGTKTIEDTIVMNEQQIVMINIVIL